MGEKDGRQSPLGPGGCRLNTVESIIGAEVFVLAFEKSLLGRCNATTLASELAECPLCSKPFNKL